MITAPAVILAILLGAQTIHTLPNRGGGFSRHRFATVTLTLFIAGNAVAALPQFTGTNDTPINTPLLQAVNEQLAALPHQPAVVLFTFDPRRNLDEEPVYNTDVAWPDDAEVIRAHDLGAMNRELFEYYARHQPQRIFYRFDEATKTMHPVP
jgi:hypothetical protein